MQSIRCIRPEQGKAGPALYGVELSDGQAVTGLRRGDLASYAAFEMALAFRGVRVDLAATEYESFRKTPRAWLRSRWLDVVAAAILAGQEEAGQQRHHSAGCRRGCRRGPLAG
jgi:hypothetical protein